MDTGVQVTDPKRAVLAGASALGALLVGMAAVVALLVAPLLGRVDRTLETLNSSLPILEQVGPDVDRLRRDVGAITPDVGAIGEDVAEVEQGLGAVDGSVRGLRDPLGTIDGSVRSVDTSVDEVARQVAGLDDSIVRLESQLQALGILPALLDELRRTSDGVAGIAEGTSTLQSQLGAVVASLERVAALLDETEQHVENLDRKTGPVLLPGSGRTAR